MRIFSSKDLARNLNVKNYWLKLRMREEKERKGEEKRKRKREIETTRETREN